jgi:uncharacterized protein (UPF0147 family)
MLKLQASYSKKVPAGEEYSSRGFSASVEREISENVSEDELKQKINEVFDLVESSVEEKLNAKDINHLPDDGKEKEDEKEQNKDTASPRQVKYLSDLSRKQNIPLDGFLYNYGLKDINELSKEQCSYLIKQVMKIAA